ncbi:MAG: hypothetical protein J1F07_02355 [Muribaculaceae bacterium]|nr:hypothetical protein [Muribaculaceae bacterium]
MTKKLIASILLMLCCLPGVRAEYTFDVGAQLNLGAGSSDFAPFYLHANRHGKLTQAYNAQLDLWAEDPLDLSRRFDFAWGVELLGGYASRVDYRRYNPALTDLPADMRWERNPQGPAAVWIQQLYGEVKWRCLYLRLGLKDLNSCFVDQELSSGDLLWSGNSRGIPEARIGFVDFQDIPLTNGWVQADICLSYGKFVDTKWINNHFDYWEGKRNPGSFWTYKRIALQSKPSKPFSFRFGFQMSGIFGGWTYKYANGQLIEQTNNYGGFKDFFLMILPLDTKTHEGYKTGDHKGTWDVAARYRFKGGETLRAYTQWFWEDGSSLLKENGWDGLWGLEFKLNRRWWITGAVAEYLDLTHMSGPISYSPGYNNTGGANLPHQAHGRDGYYTNFYYRDYVNYGLTMGTPMVQGILFDTGSNPLRPNDGGIPYFRVRGFHLAIEGAIGPDIDYIVKYNHRKAWGDTNTYTLINPVESDSFMAGASYAFRRVPGLSLGAAIAIDHGTIPSNAVGALLTLSYSCPVTLGKHHSAK